MIVDKQDKFRRLGLVAFVTVAVTACVGNVRAEEVKVADLDFRVLFEGTNVSEDLQKIICEDIELNLSHLKDVSLRDVSSEQGDPGQSYHISVSHMLDEGAQRRLFPAPLEQHFGGMVISNAIKYLVVKKELISAYRDAVEFQKRHPAAFGSLNDFLDGLKGAELRGRVENDQQFAKEILLFDHEPSQGYNYSGELAGFLRYASIRDPSILDFESKPYGDQEAVTFTTLIEWPESMTREPLVKGIPRFVFIDGKWHIYMPQLP